MTKLKSKKKLAQLVLILTIAFGTLGSFQSVSKAAYAEEVLTYYEVVTNMYSRTVSNREYKTITYRSGYNYTETKKNITTTMEKLLGNSHYAYYRTYTTY